MTGNLLGQGSKLIASMILARLLSQVSFGELGVIISTVSLLGVFAGLGLGTTATKYVADLRDRDLERTGRVIGFLTKGAVFSGALVSLIAYLLAPVMCNRVLGAPHLTQDLRIGCFLTFLNVLNGVQIGVLVGLESFRAVAAVGLADGLLSLAFASLGTYVLGLKGTVGGYALAATTLFLVAHARLVRDCKQYKIPISYRQTKAEWTVVWHFGLPALLVLASTQPFAWVARVILANQAGGYEELGLLNAALSLGGALLFLPRQISRPTLPILSNFYGKNLTAKFSIIFSASLLLTEGSGLLMALPLMLLPRSIMRYYGESYVAGFSALLVTVIAHVIGAGTLVFRDAIASSGRMWSQVLHSVIWGLVLIGVASALANKGALGIAYAYLAAYTVLFVIQWAYLSKKRLLDFSFIPQILNQYKRRR